MSEEVYVWGSFMSEEVSYLRKFHIWGSFISEEVSYLRKFFRSEEGFMSEKVVHVWRMDLLLVNGAICRVLTDWTVMTQLAMWRHWQGTLLATWRHLQCDDLGSVTHLAMWWPPWQCDAVDNVAHLANVPPLIVWRSWQCDAIDNVTSLIMWRNWQGDPRDSGDAFYWL